MTPEQLLAYRYLQRLSEELEAPLREAIRKAGLSMSRAMTRKVLSALAEGDVERTVTLLWNEPVVRAAWANVEATYTSQLMHAGRRYGVRIAATYSIRLSPPTLNPTLLRAVRSWQDDAFERIKRQHRNGMRLRVAEVLEEGLGPRKAGAALQRRMARGGLTGYDHSIVKSYRRQLIENPARAAQRALRDKRFDMKTPRVLTPKEVAARVESYERKLIAFRSQTFARTSALQAANDGQRVAWQEAVESGSVEQQQVRRYWVVGADERMCKVCEPVPGMNANGVGLNENFQTPIGSVAGPVLHPNCRCTTWTRIERAEFVQSIAPGIVRTRSNRT